MILKHCLTLFAVSFSFVVHAQDTLKLDGISIQATDTMSGQKIPSGELQLNIKSFQTNNPKFGWQVENFINESLTSQGIIPDSNAYEILYDINNANSIDELKNRNDIQLLDRKSYKDGKDIFISLNQEDKINALMAFDENVDNLYAIKTKYGNTLRNISSIEGFYDKWELNTEMYASLKEASDQNALPTSTDFVDQLSHETVFLRNFTLKYLQGETLSESEINAFNIITEDNAARGELLASASTGSGGSFGKGEITISVSLVDTLGNEVNNYRVQAIPPINYLAKRDLGLTSPATGSIPWATFCYFAIKPGTDTRISDAVVRDVRSLVGDNAPNVQLIFIGAQESNPTCIR